MSSLASLSDIETRQEEHRLAHFYKVSIASSLVPTTEQAETYEIVVCRMSDFLKEVHLHPEIVSYVNELWMPGPRYSCEPNETLGTFPTEAIRLVETEITRCIQPKYIGYYLKDGWQNSQCLGTVLITTTILFLLPNVRTLYCSGAINDSIYSDYERMWGAETLYKLIKRLQLHKKPECNFLQKLENVSLHWTATTQGTFEFLEWLTALPTMKSIQADGISTQVMQPPGRNLTPRPSNLTHFEFQGQLHDIETLEGLFQAARSLKCFVYHSSSRFDEDRRRWTKKPPPADVKGHELCSLLLRYTANSLDRFKMDLPLSVESLTEFQRLTHLDVPLDPPPIRKLPSGTSTLSAIPSSLEHLILPHDYKRPIGKMNENKGIVREIVNIKAAHLPSLRYLTISSANLSRAAYDPLRESPESFQSWFGIATKDLKEIGVELDYNGWKLDGQCSWSVHYPFTLPQSQEEAQSRWKYRLVG